MTELHPRRSCIACENVRNCPPPGDRAGWLQRETAHPDHPLHRPQRAAPVCESDVLSKLQEPHRSELSGSDRGKHYPPGLIGASIDLVFKDYTTCSASHASRDSINDTAWPARRHVLLGVPPLKARRENAGDELSIRRAMDAEKKKKIFDPKWNSQATYYGIFLIARLGRAAAWSSDAKRICAEKPRWRGA